MNKPFFHQVGASTLNELNEEIRAACHLARIDSEVVAKNIVDTLQNLERVNGEHGKYLVKIASEAMRQALKFKDEPVLMNTELKKIAAWLGMIQLGWL